MAFEQKQCLCQRCQAWRLHTRNTYDVPHLGHLLFSIVTGGIWLPVWFLHALVNNRNWGSDPFRCTVCGQAAGTFPEQRTNLPAVRAAELLAAKEARRDAHNGDRSSAPDPIFDEVVNEALGKPPVLR